MSQGLRWKLILGCLLLAALEAPDSAVVLAQDLGGPWREDADLHVAAAPLSAQSVAWVSDTDLKELRADASVNPEDLLVRAHRRPLRSDPRPLAALVVR